MRNASTALKLFLRSTKTLVYADLYTITLSGGQILRYTSADLPISYNGHTFIPYTTISDSGVKQKIGLEADGVTVTMGATNHTINGVPVMTFIRRNGLDGSNWLIERVYGPDWGSTLVGGAIRFAGRFSETSDVGDDEADISVMSWAELLNASIPSDVYQPSCLNTLFDAKCGLDRTAHNANMTVLGFGSTSVIVISGTPSEGYYSLGTVYFVDGPCAGLSRTIRTQTGQNIILVLPLPATPNIGNAIILRPGCDLSVGTCTSKFNNRIHFRGQPFVPQPETAV